MRAGFRCSLDHLINGLLFRWPNWCTNMLPMEAQSACVAGSNLPFALISLFLGVVLNFPMSYQN